MACNVSFAVDIHQTESDSESSEDDYEYIQGCPITETSSRMDGGFDTVEMTLLGESSGSRVTPHEDIEEDGQMNSLMRTRWSAVTSRVLSSMPSRSKGWSGATAHTQCHRQQMPSQASRDGNTMETELHDPSPEVSQRQSLLRNFKSESASECARRLRNMPLSLQEKCELRALVCSERGGEARCAMKVTRSGLVKTLHSFWQGVLFLLFSVHCWQGALKQVSSRFGTGVLSYFLFLKTLILYNIFFSTIIILFLVLPQVLHSSSQSTNINRFTGFEILTGTGVLSNSLLFYGYYNYTKDNSCQLTNKSEHCMSGAYNVQLAYLLIIGIGLFVTCITLVYSVSKTLGKSFRIFKSHGNLALKVFSSWDFKVNKKIPVQQQSENICLQLKELLCELGCGKPKPNPKFGLCRLLSHCTTWVLCLGSTVLSMFAINYFTQEFMISGSPAHETEFLQLPFLVCCVNQLLPTVFNMIACFESYDSISVCIYVSIIRNLLFKVCTVGLLCYHWLNSIAAQSKNDCWETFVGQELYRFLLMDMVFAVLYSIFGELLWRLISQGVLMRRRKPAFDIARNVLELIYGQTLAWIGVLFIPLLPAIQIVKLMFLFYMKRASLMMNCQAPRKPWRATQMSSLFMSLLWFPSYIGAAAFVTYTMWSVKPSSTCGPFKNLTSMFSVSESKGLASFSWAYTHFVDNPLFLFITSAFFILLIYIHTQIVDGQKIQIVLLQEQINKEVEDKKFLIDKLQALCDQQEHS